MAGQYKIKILSGRLSGRNIVLPHGECTFGGAETDLNIADDDIVAGAITISEDGISLNTSATCWINGKRVERLPHIVPMGVVVDIQGIAVVFGDADSAITVTTVPKRVVPGRYRFMWLAFIFSVVTIGLSLGAYRLHAWGSAEQPHIDHAENLSEVEELAMSRGMSLERKNGNFWELSGNCRSTDDRKVVVQELKRKGASYRDVTICEDEILKNVRTTLALHGFEGMTVRYESALNVVAISGRVLADATWREAASALSAIPGLKGWTISDEAGEKLRALVAYLRKADMLEKLSVRVDKETIFVNGILEPVEKNALEKVISAFLNEYKSGPSVIYQNTQSARDLSGIFPAPIVSVKATGELTFIELRDGALLTAGSKLSTGYQIISLDRTGIDLERNGEFLHLPIS